MSVAWLADGAAVIHERPAHVAERHLPPDPWWEPFPENGEVAKTGTPTDAQLDALAQCESGGDPTTDTGNSFYGAVQFTAGSWAAVGGMGLPSQAPLAEQYDRARALWALQGWGAWPACAERLGLPR